MLESSNIKENIIYWSIISFQSGMNLNNLVKQEVGGGGDFGRLQTLKGHPRAPQFIPQRAIFLQRLIDCFYEIMLKLPTNMKKNMGFGS